MITGKIKVPKDIVQEEKRYMDLLKVLGVLMEGVNRVVRMIIRARKSLDDIVINSAKKRENEAAELRKRGQGLAAMSDKAIKENIFTMDLSSQPAIPDIVSADAQLDLDAPWNIAASEMNLKMFEMAEVRLNHYVFKSSFMKETAARNHKQCSDDKMACRMAMKKLMDPQSTMRWAAEDHRLLQGIHMYGLRSNYYGLDLHSMACLRYTVAKSCDKAVLAIPFKNALQYVRAKQTDQQTAAGLRMNDVIDYIRKMDQPEINALKEHAVQMPIYHGIIGAGSVLYIPAAYLVFEKALKNGMRDNKTKRKTQIKKGVATGVVGCFAPLTEATAVNIQAVVELTRGMDIKGGFQHFDFGLILMYRFLSGCKINKSIVVPKLPG